MCYLRMNDDFFWDWRVLASLALSILIACVIILAISLIFYPPRYYDPNFTSRAYTGWTNTPKKLAWSSTVEKVSEEKTEPRAGK